MVSALNLGSCAFSRTVRIPFLSLARLLCFPPILGSLRRTEPQLSSMVRLRRLSAEQSRERQGRHVACGEPRRQVRQSGKARQRKRPDTIPPSATTIPFLATPARHSHRARPSKQPVTTSPASERAREGQVLIKPRAGSIHGRAAAVPRAPRNVPRTPSACSNARAPRCDHAFLLLRLRLSPPSSSSLLLLLLRQLDWETAAVMMASPRWKSGDGRPRRLLLLLCCCLLAFPCHAQAQATNNNISHRSDQGRLLC